MANDQPKTRVATAMLRVRGELADLDIHWALVGGLAVAIRAEPRFTRDVDLAVAVTTDQEAKNLISRMLGLGYRILALVEHEAVGRLATVRLCLPREGEQGVVVDLLMASSGVEREIVDMAEELEIFSGLLVPVARTGHLMGLKLLARDDRRRPQDRIDLGMLLAVANDEDIALARKTITLIQERGYSRNKDLAKEFDELLQDRPNTIGA